MSGGHWCAIGCWCRAQRCWNARSQVVLGFFVPLEDPLEESARVVTVFNCFSSVFIASPFLLDFAAVFATSFASSKNSRTDRISSFESKEDVVDALFEDDFETPTPPAASLLVAFDDEAPPPL